MPRTALHTSPMPAHILALGRLKSGDMNKTEQAYRDHLALRLSAGEILWFKFEPWKFRLANNTFYTPDFGVVASDGVAECHEVKGHWLDDARVKIKVAAELHPFRFFGIKPQPQKYGGGWLVEEFR